MSRVVVHASVVDTLPAFGMCWTHGDEPVYYTAVVRDGRSCAIFRRFIAEFSADDEGMSDFPGSLQIMVNKSAYLRSMLTNNVLSETDWELLDPSMVLSPVDNISALDVLPDECRKAFQVHISVHKAPLSYKITVVPKVCQQYTTLLDINAINFGVVPNGSHSLNLAKYFKRQVSAMGRRRFRHEYLTHPCIDPELVLERQAVIKSFCDDRMLSGLVSQRLSKLPDLDKLMMSAKGCVSAVAASKTQGLKSSVTRKFLSVLVQLYDALNDIGVLSSLLKDTVPKIDSLWLQCQKLIHLIEELFNLQQIRDGGSLIIKMQLRDLIEVYDKIRQAEKETEREINAVSAQCQNKLKVVDAAVAAPGSPSAGRIFRIPKSVEIPKRGILIRLNKAEKLFTTETMIECNTRLDELKGQTETIEGEIIHKTFRVIGSYTEPLNELVDLVGTIDIWNSISTTFALLPKGTGATMPWVFPNIVHGGEKPPCYCDIRDGRHPLLTLRDEVASAHTCVPNNFIAHGCTNYVITGPNMGGKSTYSRQQALICLMAAYGMMVPCRSAEMSLLHIFWARIGASDNPSRSSSTFMVEALETAAMLDALTNKESRKRDSTGLVVLDELGRGTSIEDGLKFATCIVTYLATLNYVVSLCATHFHELGELPNISEEQKIYPLKMGSCFDQINRYRVSEGVEKDSDGIATAQFCGFPARVIELAMRNLNK